MKIIVAIALAFALVGCTGPNWPSDQRPAGMEIKRTLFAGGGFGFRESCDALVVELTDASAARLVTGKTTEIGFELTPPSGWNMTPIAEGPRKAPYHAAFGGCRNDGVKPLGDLPGALNRPGGFYKVLHGGEAIVIIVPRAKLAGFFHFG